MVSKTYGKMPDTDSKKQILMEYEYFTDLFAESTTFNATLVDEETQAQLKAWMLTTPRLAYQYADQIIANMPSPRFKSYENSNFDEI
jgi:hypothetical protein